MKLTIGRRIFLGYLTSIVITIIVGLVSLSSVKKLLETSHWVEHTHLVLHKIDMVSVDLLLIESGQRGYALTGNEDRLVAYEKGRGNIYKNFGELKDLTKDAPAQQERLRELEGEIKARVDFAVKIVNSFKNGNPAEATRLSKSNVGKNYMDLINKNLAAMQEYEQTRLKERSLESEASGQFTVVVAWLGIVGTPIILLLIASFITRSISAPLRRLTVVADRISSGDLGVEVSDTNRTDEVGDLTNSFIRMINSLQEVARATERVASGDLTVAVEPQSKDDVVSHALISMGDNLSALIGQVQRSGIQVNSSATEIAATSKQQQATTSQISSTTSEIGSTSKEIAATSKELAASMREVAQITEDTTVLATNGQTGLGRMETTMRQIMEASSSINARLAILSDKAGNINAVVTTITKVADQTNLLSLNAAIEAEKAGEYGRGFAVVATEIRRLADQTGGATYEVEQIVKEMQSAVSASVMGMDKFSEEVRRGVEEVRQVSVQLAQIIQQVQIMKPSFESVNEGMQAQSIGAQQISEALLQLGEAAQQTAESLRQSSTAVEQLNEASRGLQASVSRFKLKN